MFSALSNVWASRSVSTTGENANDVSIASKVCEIESQNDQRARDLRHLIKLNHSEYQLFNLLSKQTNGIPDVLIAAYSIGLPSVAFYELFESEIPHTLRWSNAPSELSRLDWMNKLGQPSYQRAFVDFFEDEFVEYGYDWRSVIAKYLFKDQYALFKFSFHAGGSPLIRLASAFEVSSCDLAMEAAAMFAICPAPCETESVFLTAINDNPKGLLSMKEVLLSASKTSPGSHDSELGAEAEIHTFWSQLKWKEPIQLLDEMQQTIASLMLTQGRGSDTFSWLLRTSHALHVMSPLIPTQAFDLAQRQWWWYCMDTYLKSDRPELLPKPIYLADHLEVARNKVDQRIMKLETSLDKTTILNLHALLSASKTSKNPEVFPRTALHLLDCYNLD